ncbi:MAG: lysophospholipid acyltransferase family protein [Pseudomonadota bacterium]|nr:lysophospholipid acyltransferase family protein [Pseudomonadota bacterium]
MLARLSSVLRLTVGAIYMAFAVAIFAVLVLVFLPSRSLRIRTCNVFGHVTGRVCLWLSGASVPDGIAEQVRATHPAIYISNHTSMLDIFVGIWLAPIGTVGVAKKQVVYYPFFGQLYAISGHILLDRSNHASAVDALKETAEIIRKYGIGVWMWPEGTRAKDGRLRPFKKGFAHLAIATRLPIVPVVVTGAHKAMQKNSLTIRPTTLGLRALPAISTDDWTLENLDEKVAQVYAAFDQALPDEQKALPLPPADRATGS